MTLRSFFRFKNRALLLLVCASFSGAVSYAQTSWTGAAGDGDFSNPLNWTAGTPTSAVSAIIPAGPTTVTLSGSGSVLDLTLGTQNNLNVGGHALNIFGPAISNAGQININNGFLTLNASSTLSGGGTLSLTSDVFVNESGGAFTLTNANNLIEGTGELGENGLSLINQAGGTVNANVLNGSLSIDGGGSLTNAGLLEASNGGTLDISNNATNTGGNITANNGTVNLSGTVTGGTLNSLNGGVLQTSGSTTLTNVTISSGSTYIASGHTNIQGTITNNGTIASPNGFLTVVGGDLTLQGGGTVSLTSDAFVNQSGGSFILHNVNNLIEGTGDVGENGLSLDNQLHGLVNANISGGSLSLDGGGSISNANILEATNGGILNISNNVTNTSGASITAASGGTVNLSATVNGGTLNALTGSTFQTAGDATLVNVTLSSGSTYSAAGNTFVQGTFTNLGTVTSPNGNITLNGGDLVLQGGGTVNMALDTFIDDSGGAFTLHNVDNTIQGSGAIGVNGLTLDNQAHGVVNANISGATLALNGGGLVSNANILEATNGGILNITNDVTNTSAASITAAGGSTVNLSSTINGGTLNALAGNTLQTSGAATLVNVTLSSGSSYVASGNTFLQGTFINHGTVTSPDGNFILNSGDLQLQGGGTVNMVTDTFIENSGGVFTLHNVDNTIQGSGAIGVSGLTLDNQAGGTVDANVSGVTLALNGGGTVTNAGVLEATNGGILTITNTVNDSTGITANGGTVNIGAQINGGDLTTKNGGTMQNIGGTVLNGITLTSGSTFGTGGNTLLENTITNQGTFTSPNGFISVTNGDVTLQGGGTVNLVTDAFIDANGGTFTLHNVDNTIQGAGQVGVNGLALDNQVGGTVDANLSGQTLGLTGGGLVTNAGVLEATNGGILNVSTTVNDSSAITADNATVNIGSQINGGSLAVVNGGTMQSTGAAILNGVTLTSGSTFNAGLLTELEGTITNKGTFTSPNGTISVAAGDVTLQGGGTVQLTGDAFLNDTGGAFVLHNVDNTIEGSGQIGENGLSIDNQVGGTILANVAQKTLVINGSGTLTNNGTMQVNAGSALAMASNTALTNFSGNTLTGGTYIVNGSSALNGTGTLQLNLGGNTGGEIVNNAATIVLNGPTANTLFLDANGNSALSSLAANSTASSSLTVKGGYTFTTAGSFSNAGTVHVGSGGTFNASNAITGTTGTLQVDSGGALSIAAGTSPSTTGTLAQNGTLALGSNSITVSNSYTNANFGVGNGFNNHADVTGTGPILAAGNTAEAVSGPAVSGGTSAAPALQSFGNVHLGQSVTLDYSITNTGTTGPSITGAIQTNVNGGNITDSRLSGSGVTAGNYGTLGLGQSATFAVTFTATTAGALNPDQSIHIANNFDNVQGQTISVGGGAAYQLAQANTLATPINLGNVHVGDTASTNLSVTNTAPGTGGFTETLGANVTGTTGGATSVGSVTGLAAQANSTAIGVGLNTQTAGALSGTATVSFSSQAINNSGLGNTALGSQTVSLSGTAYNLASANLGTVDFGKVLVGSTESQFLSVTNSAPVGRFSEGLDATLGAFSGASATELSGSGSITNLLAGSTSTNGLNVTLDATKAGTITASVLVNLTSDGAGTSGLGLTQLAGQSTSIAGVVNEVVEVGNLASASSATPNPVNLGNVRVNAVSPTQSLSISNTATGPAEGLNASISTSSPGLTATGTIASLQAGNSDSSSLVVGMNTSTAGLKNGSATIALASDGSFNGGVTTALQAQTVNVTGAVYQTAQATVLPSSPISLGSSRINGTLNQALTISNSAIATGGFTETLGGSVTGTTGSALSSGSITGLAQGASSTAINLGLSTVTAGNVTGSATLGFESQAINNSGLGTLALGSQNVALSGTVYQTAEANTLPTTVNLGTVRTGTVINTALGVSNVAPGTGGFTENLGASFGAVGPGLTGSGSVSGLAQGAPTNTALSVGFTAGAAGAFSSSAAVNFETEAINNSGLGNLGIGSQTVDVTANVNALASLELTSSSGFFSSTGANSGVLNFGTVTAGPGSDVAELDLFNNVTGPADELLGSIDASGLSGSPFAFGGNDTFDLGAGEDSGFNVTLNLNTATGSFSENLVIDEASHNSFQSDLDLPQYDLTIEGTIGTGGTSPAPDSAETVVLLGIGLFGLSLVSRWKRKMAVAVSISL